MEMAKSHLKNSLRSVRDFLRGLDLNHDGKIAADDWDILLSDERQGEERHGGGETGEAKERLPPRTWRGSTAVACRTCLRRFITTVVFTS
jgi:hypothetical protein